MDFNGEFRGERGNNVVELGTFSGDVPRVKLGLHLSEPQLWVRRPEGWDLDSDSCDGRECGQKLR